MYEYVEHEENEAEVKYCSDEDGMRFWSVWMNIGHFIRIYRHAELEAK